MPISVNNKRERQLFIKDMEDFRTVETHPMKNSFISLSGPLSTFNRDLASLKSSPNKNLYLGDGLEKNWRQVQIQKFGVAKFSKFVVEAKKGQRKEKAACDVISLRRRKSEANEGQMTQKMGKAKKSLALLRFQNAPDNFASTEGEQKESNASRI